MINLIPPEGQKVVKREYIFRVGGTLAFLFGGVLVALAIAFIPTYVLVDAQIKTLLAEAKRDKVEAESFAEADAEVKMTKSLIRQLRSLPPGIMVSGAIGVIQNLAPFGVTLGTFVVDEKDGKIESIKVQGTATTREALIRFKNALEASDMFAKAEVPIADLARDIDLPFMITLTLESTQ